MKIRKEFLFVLIITLITCYSYAKSPFLIYYGDNASLNYLNSFKEVVLDPDHFDSVKGIKAYKYGYISIGEVENFREYFKFVKNFGVLKGENPVWKGSYFVSLKTGKWQIILIFLKSAKCLMKELIMLE
jgi:endo-alpha-1,4-polygalactosaminidase (GH114 family)